MWQKIARSFVGHPQFIHISNVKFRQFIGKQLALPLEHKLPETDFVASCKAKMGQFGKKRIQAQQLHETLPGNSSKEFCRFID
jgi:hypothetical protein